MALNTGIKMMVYLLSGNNLESPLKVVAHVGQNSHASVCHQSVHTLTPQCYSYTSLVLMRGVSQSWLLKAKGVFPLLLLCKLNTLFVVPIARQVFVLVIQN